MLTILLVIVSNQYYWIRIPATIVVLIELASTISIIIVFGCALSLALGLNAFSTPPFETFDSADLTFFALLDPLSRALTITSALISMLLVVTSTTRLTKFLRKRRTEVKDVRSFEPTISALGMSRSFYALHPQRRASDEITPTVYDPYSISQKEPAGWPSSQQVTFANESAWISRKHSRWSSSTTSPKGIEGDIMRLLEVKKVRRVVPVRPARPWNEVWNGREGADAN